MWIKIIHIINIIIPLILLIVILLIGIILGICIPYEQLEDMGVIVVILIAIPVLLVISFLPNLEQIYIKKYWHWLYLLGVDASNWYAKRQEAPLDIVLKQIYLKQLSEGEATINKRLDYLEQKAEDINKFYNFNNEEYNSMIEEAAKSKTVGDFLYKMGYGRYTCIKSYGNKEAVMTLACIALELSALRQNNKQAHRLYKIEVEVL